MYSQILLKSIPCKYKFFLRPLPRPQNANLTGNDFLFTDKKLLLLKLDESYHLLQFIVLLHRSTQLHADIPIM